MSICQNAGGDIPHHDLEFYVGDDDNFIFYWSTKYLDPDTGIETKTPVDMTGYTADMHFRNDYEGGAAQDPVHSEAGVIDPLIGKVTFTLTKAELRTLFGDAYAKKIYIHDVQVTDTTGLNRTLLLGNVTLFNDITRTP